MQARFAFRDERELRVPIFCIRNKPGHDSGLAHHILLLALPTIGMCEDKMRPRFEAMPKVGAVRVCLLNISLSTLIEISQEVGEDINGALASWQRWDCVGNARGGWTPGAKVKLEPTRESISPKRKGS